MAEAGEEKGGVATADTWTEKDFSATAGSSEAAPGGGGKEPPGGGGILIEFKDRPKIDKTQNRPKIGQR